MLPTPGAVETAPDGGLILTDGAGKSTAVPAENLPFMAGGGRLEHLGDFSATALGTSTGGILHSPAVVINLTSDGGKIRTECVGDHWLEKQQVSCVASPPAVSLSVIPFGFSENRAATTLSHCHALDLNSMPLQSSPIACGFLPSAPQCGADGSVERLDGAEILQSNPGATFPLLFLHPPATRSHTSEIAAGFKPIP